MGPHLWDAIPRNLTAYDTTPAASWEHVGREGWLCAPIRYVGVWCVVSCRLLCPPTLESNTKTPAARTTEIICAYIRPMDQPGASIYPRSCISVSPIKTHSDPRPHNTRPGICTPIFCFRLTRPHPNPAPPSFASCVFFFFFFFFRFGVPVPA